MFEKDNVVNDLFVNATAKTYLKGQVFPHAAGMAFRLLSGKIKAVLCPRRNGKATERVFTAAGEGGCTVFETNPDSDYVVVEDAKVFAFPREQVLELCSKMLSESYCLHIEKGHITLPPPAPEAETEEKDATVDLPKRNAARPDPAVTVAAMPAAKRRTPSDTPPISTRSSTPPPVTVPSRKGNDRELVELTAQAERGVAAAVALVNANAMAGFIPPPPSQEATQSSAIPSFKQPSSPHHHTLLGVAAQRLDGRDLDMPHPASLRSITPNRHQTRIGLPFPTTHVNGEARDIPKKDVPAINVIGSAGEAE